MTTNATKTKKQEIQELMEMEYDVYSQTMKEIPIMPGWNSNNSNFKTLVPKGENKLCIEVGSWTGGSAKTIAEELDESSCLVCCDTFLGSKEHFIDKSIEVPRFNNGRPALFEMFIANTFDQRAKILPMQTTSNVVYHVLKHYRLKADFIYIDGDHTEAVVREDVLKYYELLEDGGVLLGDDYDHGGVKKGLDSTSYEYTVNEGQFIIRKT